LVFVRKSHAQQAHECDQKEVSEKGQLKGNFAQPKDQVHQAQAHAHESNVLNVLVGVVSDTPEVPQAQTIHGAHGQ
jgi:hypothetical protein